MVSGEHVAGYHPTDVRLTTALFDSCRPLVVGCPIRDRAWSVDSWFGAIEAACQHARKTATYVLLLDPRDRPTFDLVEAWADRVDLHLTLVEEEPLPDGDPRGWQRPERIAHMVEIRNQLLGLVRDLQPAHYWSVDSDIMVAPDSLVSALSCMTTSGYDAVATLTWMMPQGYEWPNYGVWDPAHGGMRRFPTEPGGRWPADIIMAAKLMSPAAYNVDYQAHHDGEDVGWSLACRAQGLRFAIDGHRPAKHVMGPAALGRLDERCGF